MTAGRLPNPLSLRPEDDDEAFFHDDSNSAIKEEPSSPMLPPMTYLGQSSLPRSSPQGLLEYEPETKPKSKLKKKPRGNRKRIARTLRDLFQPPPGCTREDFQDRMGHVNKARRTELNAVRNRLRSLRSGLDSAMGLECAKHVRSKAETEITYKMVQDGTHFTLVATRLGLIPRTETHRTPTSKIQECDQKQDLLSTLPECQVNTLFGGKLDLLDRVEVQQSRLGPNVGCGEGSDDDPLPFDKPFTRLPSSCWTGEWENLELSFHALYQEAQEKRQGIRLHEGQEVRKSPIGDAFVESSRILDAMLKEPLFENGMDGEANETKQDKARCQQMELEFIEMAVKKDEKM
ncbi:MAG: hypothetical protein M1821_008334 [Bathelium mastoideum]|nr:MAG: hypothetical protein M1821_008334 [Bathelium mastoideum]KAI9693373.1 MAG: hypothetical protein M1822_005369 [Bathelium mastoideum]